MISSEDIKHLAALSRMDVSEEETKQLAGEIDSILGYVSQIKDAAGDAAHIVPPLRNIMRDDIPEHTARQYTEKILANAPAREGDYLKVKKILS